MSSLIIIQNRDGELNDHAFIKAKLPNWNIFILDCVDYPTDYIDRQIRENEIHFLIYETTLNARASGMLSHLQHKHPLLSVIYYYSFLKDSDFSELYQAGISHCIVGDSRQANLIDTLSRLWYTHWKRIPESILDITPAQLSQRATLILRTIENRPIRECNTYQLSKILNISESHFRKEFKRHFNINFREFKNRLFTHYEHVLLFDKKMKPGDIFQVLDYKNISAFSRSFKMRHGNSWQSMVRSTN